MRALLLIIENVFWSLRCSYNLWVHGPYGLSKVVEKMPFRFLIRYLTKYGATIGKDCRFERGINLHRPLGEKPFRNLIIGNSVYLGHNTLIDLTERVEIRDSVIIASRCQIWTHASYYKNKNISDPGYAEYRSPVLIDTGALIYSNCVITHGVTIGSFSVIGANSLVNKSIEPLVFAGGVPAKIIRTV